MHQKSGTPYYIAPEVIKGTYTEKCDLWSVGVILFILLSGKPPFSGSTDQILSKVKKGNYSFSNKCWDTISEEAKDLIGKLMEKDQEKRVCALEALKHRWFELHTVK